jgi:hypothetical protein
MPSHLPISGSLGEFDLAAILAHMQRQELDGQLKVAAAAFTKTLWLQDGCIVFAQSSLGEDSLGSFLLRRGVIDREQFEKSRRRMQKHGSRHGRALMEMGLLDPERLWSEMSAHLRAILFSLFPLRAGRYDIAALPADARENIRIELPVPAAILEGARLIVDEEFIESRFEPGLALYAAPDRRLPGAALKPYEAHVLSLVSDGCALEEVVRRSELLRFNTLKVLYALLRLGLIGDCRQPARHAAPTPATAQLPTTFTSFDEALQYYNARFEYIFRVLGKEIGPVAHAILSDAIAAVLDAIPPGFQGLALRPDGRVDERSVMKSVWYEDFAANSNEFLRGLEEILYAEIFAVKRHLGKEHERQLLRWIRESAT